ncbi:hypothetical protein BGW80DRAFT_453415 [Lactifluus volemus]|nr:hypothetical protein BGW80DRAFT_453415 [Lactifluus volemus]
MVGPAAVPPRQFTLCVTTPAAPHGSPIAANSWPFGMLAHCRRHRRFLPSQLCSCCAALPLLVVTTAWLASTADSCGPSSWPIAAPTASISRSLAALPPVVDESFPCPTLAGFIVTVACEQACECLLQSQEFLAPSISQRLAAIFVLPPRGHVKFG